MPPFASNGRRVFKSVGSTQTETIYDRQGSVILYNTTAAANSQFIQLYAGSMHIGSYVVNSTVTDTIFYYNHADWLGTERACTNLSGVACETTASLPFGDGQTIAGSCGDISPMHFTGKERDTESSLDNFGARYFASSFGRFMQADPLLNSGRPSDPQSWNRYVYVANNPLKSIDHTGLYFFNNTCGLSDDACNTAFAQTQKNVRSMYAATQAAYDKALKAGDTKAVTALKRTLDGLGAEGQKNARGQTVNISVDLGLNAGGKTSFEKGSTSVIDIVLNPNTSNGDNGTQAGAAHEGVHAGEVMPGTMTYEQFYGLEHNANETESYFSQAIGYDNIRSPIDGSDMVDGVLDLSKDIVLWNTSWANVDAATLSSWRSKGVDAAAKDGATFDCQQQGGCKK